MADITVKSRTARNPRRKREDSARVSGREAKRTPVVLVNRCSRVVFASNTTAR